MGKNYPQVPKRAYMELEEGQVRDRSSDQPSELPISDLTPSNDSPLGICSNTKWRNYLIDNGLIDAEVLKRKPKPYPLKGQRLREYRKSMEKLKCDFNTEIIPNFDMNTVCRDSIKRQPREKMEKDFEEHNEPSLRVLEGVNTIVCDDTANG